MASYDAGTLTNQSKRSARIYKDLNLDFQQNTATKDIQKITDIESVKRSVRNLINTNHYEKPFRPQVGSPTLPQPKPFILTVLDPETIAAE